MLAMTDSVTVEPTIGDQNVVFLGLDVSKENGKYSGVQSVVGEIHAEELVHDGQDHRALGVHLQKDVGHVTGQIHVRLLLS